MTKIANFVRKMTRNNDIIVERIYFHRSYTYSLAAFSGCIYRADEYNFERIKFPVFPVIAKWSLGNVIIIRDGVSRASSDNNKIF